MTSDRNGLYEQLDVLATDVLSRPKSIGFQLAVLYLTVPYLDGGVSLFLNLFSLYFLLIVAKSSLLGGFSVVVIIFSVTSFFLYGFFSLLESVAISLNFLIVWHLFYRKRIFSPCKNLAKYIDHLEKERSRFDEIDQEIIGNCIEHSTYIRYVVSQHHLGFFRMDGIDPGYGEFGYAVLSGQKLAKTLRSFFFYFWSSITCHHTQSFLNFTNHETTPLRGFALALTTSNEVSLKGTKSHCLSAFSVYLMRRPFMKLVTLIGLPSSIHGDFLKVCEDLNVTVLSPPNHFFYHFMSFFYNDFSYERTSDGCYSGGGYDHQSRQPGSNRLGDIGHVIDQMGSYEPMEQQLYSEPLFHNFTVTNHGSISEDFVLRDVSDSLRFGASTDHLSIYSDPPSDGYCKGDLPFLPWDEASVCSFHLSFLLLFFETLQFIYYSVILKALMYRSMMLTAPTNHWKSYIMVPFTSRRLDFESDFHFFSGDAAGENSGGSNFLPPLPIYQEFDLSAYDIWKVKKEQEDGRRRLLTECEIEVNIYLLATTLKVPYPCSRFELRDAILKHYVETKRILIKSRRKRCKKRYIRNRVKRDAIKPVVESSFFQGFNPKLSSLT